MKKVQKERSREELRAIRQKLEAERSVHDLGIIQAKMAIGMVVSFLIFILSAFGEAGILHPVCLVTLVALVAFLGFGVYFSDSSVRWRRRRLRRQLGHWK